MNALVSTALWVVGKALAPVADGVLGHWDASKNLGLNVEALSMELLLVKATLENASRKHIGGQATEELLRKLQDSACCAEDLLDELDYYRIHDELHGSYDAADQHAKGGVHDLVLNARHTARAVLGLSSAATPVEDAKQHVGCCAWPRAKRRSRDTSSSTPITNHADVEEVSGCIPKLGKIFPCSSSPNVHDVNSGGQSTVCGAPQSELGFNRVDVSKRMNQIVQQLQPLRRNFATILQSCDRITVPDIAQSRPITTGQCLEPKLYGRDDVVKNIIHDMTKGKHHSKNLTVIPIVGPGGIGKTTLIEHIYHNKEVQNHFHVLIWVCVSLSFNLNKLLEDIKQRIPRVEGEQGDGAELIEQRLKSKRFLLVLDDIWERNEDNWKRLLLPLRASLEKGSMIIVTTRFPSIAQMVKTTDHIELKGLESEEFRNLFLAFVFGDEPFISDHSFLLQIGYKIIEKLKGSPLAAKTVGRLLRNDLNLRHWRRVLESKEWESQTGANDIMPALKLSYDYLPLHQQQCFSSSALFPEDHKYSSTELIDLWIGLDILQPGGRNQTLKDIGLSNLSDLVTHGFFREEETGGGMHYVIHDLLHELASKVASHEFLTIHHSNVGSVEVQPSVRHLSIIIDDADTVSHEHFKSQLTSLKERLKVKRLQTLMLFGKMDESLASTLGDLFREANALRILYLVNMMSSVESMLHNFSALVHLRYLCLGTKHEMPLPLAISRFYHLRILDLGSWYRCHDLPKDLSNLAKLRRFYTPSDELHSDILNVGKLVLLEELKIFRVNKEIEGFEPKQLENLTELREIGIYNLENIHTREEAAKAKLKEKNYLESLTLEWDSKRSNIEPDVEAVVLDSLQPHGYLEELCIRGHGGPSCPTWLGDNLTAEALQYLHLDDVSWQCLPSLGKMWGLGKLILKHIATVKEFVIEESFCKLIRLELVGLGSFEKWVPSQDARMFPLLQVLIIRECHKLSKLPFSNPNQNWNIDWFPKLQELEIEKCPEILLVARIPWTERLRQVSITDVKLLERFKYNSKSSELYIAGKDDLHSLDQVLVFNNLTGLEELCLNKCPPLELKNLLKLTSLKKLVVVSSDGPLIVPLGDDDDVEWQHPVEGLSVKGLHGASGKELTELLSHLPRLSYLSISGCTNITHMAAGVNLQQHTTSATSTLSEEKEEKEDGLLLFPTHLADSLRELTIADCPELVLLDGAGGGTGGWLQALRSLQTLRIEDSPKFLSSLGSFPCCPFPSSLRELDLEGGVEGMGTLEPLSNLISLTRLDLKGCGEDLKCKGIGPLLTAGGQLRVLIVLGSPEFFFAGWDPNPRRALLLQDYEGGEEQLVSPRAVCSSKPQELYTDDAMGLLAAAPLCSLLSSSHTRLHLFGTPFSSLPPSSKEIERFSKEQEDAFLILASLQQLVFRRFDKLQHLPTVLHKLTNLTELEVSSCPAVRSLPKDGLPKSLQVLDVWACHNKELKQQCRGLVGTIPRIRL